MKKVLSILFAALILISGMHLSIATHICGGEIADVKLSFSSEKASCGMENETQSSPSGNNITSRCCQNEITVLSVDNNYNPSSIQLKEVTKSLLQVFNIPVNIINQFYSESNLLIASISSPYRLQANAVSLSQLCIFRI